MKNLFIALIFIFLALLSKAQYSITYTSNPIPGDKQTVIFTSTVGLTPPVTGTNKLWNYNYLQMTGSSSSQTYVALSSVPNKNLFPSATIATHDGNSNYNMYNNTTASRIYLGSAQPSVTDCIVFANPVTELTLPFAYSDSSTDTYSYATNSYTESGTYLVQGSGTGTLVLPSYTLSNALLVRTTVTGNLFFGSGSLTYTVMLFDFYNNTSKFPLLSISTNTTNDGTSIDTDISATVLNNYAFGVGIEENNGLDFGVKIYPNPVSQGYTTIELKENPGTDTRVTLYNMLGQEVKTLSVSDFTDNSYKFNTEDLAQGVYQLRFSSGGKSYTTKLVIK